MLFDTNYKKTEVLAFESPVVIGGVNASYFQFSGVGATDGQNKTVCHIDLFFTLDGIVCEQQLVLTYLTGANTSLELNLQSIIDSISLE